MQPLKLATSNLVHNLGLGLAYQKNNVYDQNRRGCGTGEHQKKVRTPLRIFATVQASNFKFGTQLGFGISLPKNNVLDQNWQGSWPGEHPRQIWDPLRIFATVEANNFKFGTQIGFGLAYQKKRRLVHTKISGRLG